MVAQVIVPPGGMNGAEGSYMRTRHFLPFLFAALSSVVMGCAAEAEDEAENGGSAVSDSVVKGIGVELKGAEGATALTKNEDALAAKLAVVDAAQKGETLDISYYIFSDDESSAFYATRIVEAAKRGVKVRLMLDYLTNFGRYNYFKAMQDAAGGKDALQIRFYNKPSKNILEDVRYLVTPCSLADKTINTPECTADRKAKSSSAESAAAADLFISGLYAKNAGALQASLGPVIAQYEALQKAGGETTPEDKAKALAGLKLVFDAKVKGDVGAMLLVFLAGDKLAPIHDFWAALIPAAGGEHKRDWQHLTDFNHQKLTLRTAADGKGEIVLGGRNVENSYHLSGLPQERGEEWKAKYVFMDVDFHAKYSNANGIKARFEKVWDFKDMVATMGDDVETLTKTNLKVGDAPLLKGYSYADIEGAATRFTRTYATWKDGKLTINFKSPAVNEAAGLFPQLAVEDKDARYYYVDNVHNPNGRRVFGMDIEYGDELENGKQIQELWNRALVDLCKNGAGKDANGNIIKTDIVFHNAYLSLPGRLQYQLFERARLRGNETRFECSKGVRQVKIITNSRESTDLNIVNVYNDAWLKATLEADKKIDGQYFVDYREYKTTGRSLHAKVMVFGNDVFIGSANADGRSQFMDANNGVFIRNAPKLAEAYKNYLAKTVGGMLVPNEDPRQLRAVERKIGAVSSENAEFLGRVLESRGHADLKPYVSKRINEDSNTLYTTSKKCFEEYDKDCIVGIDKLLQPL